MARRSARACGRCGVGQLWWQVQAPCLYCPSLTQARLRPQPRRTTHLALQRRRERLPQPLHAVLDAGAEGRRHEAEAVDAHLRRQALEVARRSLEVTGARVLLFKGCFGVGRLPQLQRPGALQDSRRAPTHPRAATPPHHLEALKVCLPVRRLVAARLHQRLQRVRPAAAAACRRRLGPREARPVAQLGRLGLEADEERLGRIVHLWGRRLCVGQ
jgi:hypothetical protein